MTLRLALDSPEATLETVGGKGASLARLAQAKLPVPRAFFLTTAAYRQFVTANDLQVRILAASSAADPDDPASLDRASVTIAALFADGAMPEDIASAVSHGYASLGGSEGEAAVAVRSSATAEDLPDLSFAGQQDTFLNIRGETAVLAAVRECWASLWTPRAIGYRRRHDVPAADLALAVVIQKLVPADAAGVLFTANPVSGALDQVVVNAVWGLGEALVSGQVTADTILVDKASLAIIEQTVADKPIMLVPGDGGTEAVPVPVERRRAPVLSPVQVTRLVDLGLRIESLYGRAMDVEWAIHEASVFILQARPITRLVAPEAEPAEWNDSLKGDFLWTSANLGEAVPDVMTPVTWAVLQRFIHGAMRANFTQHYSPVGIIGGRFYMNLSLTATQASVIFMPRKYLISLLEQVFGHIPDDLDIPLVPVSRWQVARELIPAAIQLQLRVRRNLRRFPAFLQTAPARSSALRARIDATTRAHELLELWHAELAPYFDEACSMLEAATRRDGGALLRVRRDLVKLAGQTDADLLMAGLQARGRGLASLGPLLALERLARGEIDRATYAREWGHRGPHEFELSTPRSAEDPDWIDRQLAGLRTATSDVSSLLARQRAASGAAWDRFAQRFPGRVVAMRRRVELAANVFRGREAARSEVVRAFWPVRVFLIRAGAMLGRPDDVFFLSLDEVLEVLGGSERPLASVAPRRVAYKRFSALPPYPQLIRGAFDPFLWAADPDRRPDVFDARRVHRPVASDVLRGFPGAPGLVEGRARVIASADEADLLQPGEILVTTVTNVGWTPMFPRAAAIVTDVGAPLSHAAIVARELGIPAVVGSGTATQRIHTGDLLRVDGSQGTVEVLGSSPADKSQLVSAAPHPTDDA